MKNGLLCLFGCLVIQAVCCVSGELWAQSAVPDTLSWSWEVSSSSTHSKACTIEFTDNLLVNWGDGITEWIPDSASSKSITHVYDAEANYSCTAIGVGISYFKADSKRVLSMETGKAPNLAYISITSNLVASLDVSKNPKLVSLYCGGNNLTELLLGNNLLLQTLTCSDNKLVNLDISMLPLLKKVTAHTNLLTGIKVCKTGVLSYLSCASCNLSALSLDEIFEALPTLENISTSKNLYVLNNPGSSSCNSAIAAAKNWTLDRVITQSSLYIPSVSCRPSDSVRVSVCLKNVTPAIAFEMDLIMPDGFILDTLRTGLEASRMGQHVLSIAKIPETTSLYKFMVYSMKSKDVFIGSDGTVLQLYLKSPSVVNTYTLDIKNVILIDTLTNVADVSVTDGQITVNTAALMGDANGDAVVNVTDVVFIVARINGRMPPGFVADAADMDGNGLWNIADVTKMVEVINSQGGSESSSAPMRQRVQGRTPNLYDDAYAGAGIHMFMRQSDKFPAKLELCMDNVEAVQAFQVDLILPDNVSFNASGLFEKTSRSSNHVFSLVKVSDDENRWRMISYALRPDMAYGGSTGALAVIEMECKSGFQPGTYSVYLENQLFTGMEMTSVNGSSYDLRMIFEKEKTTATDFDVYVCDGGLIVVGNSLQSIMIWDITGHEISSVLNPADWKTKIELKSGIYISRICLQDGTYVFRKILVP